MSRSSRELFSIVFAAALVCAGKAHAQDAASITLKSGETLALAQVVFPIPPDLIPYKWPKTKDPRPWCVFAKCMPLERAQVLQVLGPNAVHYRVDGNGRGALFMGDTQMSEFAAVRPPAMDADPSLLKKTPVVGLKTGTAVTAPAIYWVRVGSK